MTQRVAILEIEHIRRDFVDHYRESKRKTFSRKDIDGLVEAFDRLFYLIEAWGGKFLPADVQALMVEPDDWIVLSTSMHLTSAQVASLRDRGQELFPGHKIVVLSAGLKFDTLSTGLRT